MKSSLSGTPSAIKWISQFPLHEQKSLADLLDGIQLFEDAKVAICISQQLEKFGNGNERVALYAEREMTKKEIFTSEYIADANGRIRKRAVGKAPQAVQPKRGASRVGSEGFVAFQISQAVKKYPRIFLNHPKPDQFRKSRKRGVHAITIVTDFIGSGTRIRKQLDAFWNVPSVTSWHSMGLLSFHIVTAACTPSGKRTIEQHKCKPVVHCSYIVPTVRGRQKKQSNEWVSLAEKYGPTVEPLGFGDIGALVAFRYGMPNNAPKLLWDTESKYEPFMPGPAPRDIIRAFYDEQSGLPRLQRVLQYFKGHLRDALSVLIPSRQERATKLAFLSSLRGRWSKGMEVFLAQRHGLTVPEVLKLKEHALENGWIAANGRITDRGKKLLGAAQLSRWRRPVVTTNATPYYPRRLRVP